MEKRSGKERQSDLTAHLTGILLLDIDFFKRINDNYGHNAGDAVLIEVSQRLSCCRDHYCALGRRGNCFIIRYSWHLF